MSVKDKLEKAGGTAIVAVSFVDRALAWWKARKERKAEEKRLAKHESERRGEHEMQLISDEAAFRAGRGRCDEPECRRPKFHSGDHGPRLKKWGET